MSKRPNILWISFEDTYPFYGCYGDPVACTPRLDRLAAEGCRWPNAFSTAPVCSPARSAVITGMYPVSIGTHHHRTNSGTHYPNLGFSYEAVPPPYVKCFSERFRAVGYYCTNNAKTDYQFSPPRSAWDDCSAHAHWRNRPDPEQPFVAVFNLDPTHESGMWANQEADPSIDRERIPVPPYFPDTPKVRESMARLYTHLEHPYLLWNAYRNRHPIMQELWRCHVEGSLDATQQLLFRTARPAEELYDVTADPHEINDLAGDPAYAGELLRLGAALDNWRHDVKDLGDEPEDMMRRRMWPDGHQPVTGSPQCVVLGPHAHGDNTMPEPGGTFRGPAILQLQSPTQGASISYAWGDDGPWQLYSAPLPLPQGKSTLRAVAGRIGYAESAVVTATFLILPANGNAPP